MFAHILIPTDGSPLSNTAVQSAMALARDAGAKVTVFTAVEPFRLLTWSSSQIEATRADYERQAHATAGEFLSAAEQIARQFGVPCDVVQVESDDPWRAIVETADARDCDLIAMASHGRRGVAALVLGSVTQKVLTHSTVPVLVYR
ncbi:universal stress protein [Starkeya sp. 3C]|uniref:Universal stress protein n=1 Tax=Ancylobacter moscoviensis TaxID=2597768 RepID=A0ABY3DVH7_9HYPH|nr:universal stress protein [Ancylobacter moscoviensis]TSJ64439.1 universal stress protein [Ancylobacter moscoviensis]